MWPFRTVRGWRVVVMVVVVVREGGFQLAIDWDKVMGLITSE